MFLFFFFKQKTAYEMRISDWSSDVCSSDLGKPRWGDKTPFYTPDIDIIRRVFPDAKIVHLVRDGRDVVLSQRSIVDVWEPAEAGVGLAVEDHHRPQKIGRASCRERVGKYV